MNADADVSRRPYPASMIWIAGTIACLTALLGATYGEHATVAGIAKAAASTCFIMVAVTRGAFTSRYGTLIFAGLVLSWFGDVFLIGRAQALFLAGLTSFLLGHAAYACAFVAHGIRPRWSILSLAALVPLVAVVLWWLMPHVDGAMKIPVAAYMIVITAMVALSWGARGNGGHVSMPIGAMLFFFSDIAVARNRFVDTESMDWLWGLPMYYFGQLFLAYSVSTTRPSPSENEDSGS